MADSDEPDALPEHIATQEQFWTGMHLARKTIYLMVEKSAWD
jgi:hypothetical protein